MPKRNDLRIGKRTVDGLSVEGKEAVFWDHDLPGFGVRVYTSGRKVYVVQSRGPRGLKRVTIGEHGELSADQARKRQRRSSTASNAARIRLPHRRKRHSPWPVWRSATCALMWARIAMHIPPGSTRGVLDNHILPELGKIPIGAVGREHVAALHYRLRDTPRAANRTIKILSKMFSLAESWDLAPPGKNPCRSVRHYTEQPRERFLTREEFQQLGRVLDEAEAARLGVAARGGSDPPADC